MDHCLEQRHPGLNRDAGFRHSDRHHGLGQLRSLTDMNFAPVQRRFFSLLSGPKLIANRIVNHAHDNFALVAQRNRDAEMRNAIEIIYRSVQRIDHPLKHARLVANDSFFAIERVLRKFF